MRFEAADLIRVHLPLVEPFVTPHGVETVRDLLLVHLRGPDGEGWGECGALGVPFYTSEYTAGAHAVVRDHLLPQLATALRTRPIGAEEVESALAGVKGHPMAKTAIEMAVLDAELRDRGQSLADYLGADRDEVPAGVALGLASSVDVLTAEVKRCVDQGYGRVKLKIHPGWDVEPVRAVRNQFGDALALAVDANGTYTLEDSDHLATLDEYGLAFIEQPLTDDDASLALHAELARRLRTPVCLDESITSATRASEAISRGACTVVNLKAPRVGGYLEARKVHDVCRAGGVAAWVGGMLDSGLARSANLALAALPGCTLPGDLSATDRFWTRDVTPPIAIEDGCLKVPAGPGIGTLPDPDALAELTTSTDTVSL